MARLPVVWRIPAAALLCLAAGCYSPYHADRGALLGGLGGAGVGAIIGNQLGSTGAGAAIGAGVGALTGAAIGSGLDEVEARNRALIAAQMGREVRAGAVTIDDVVAMSQAGVGQELIINHVRAHGMVAPLAAADLIHLQQQGVSTAVIQSMQSVPAPAAQPAVIATAPPPVIVEEHYIAPPWYGHHHHHYGHPHHGPRVGWGVSVSSDDF